MTSATDYILDCPFPEHMLNADNEEGIFTAASIIDDSFAFLHQGSSNASDFVMLAKSLAASPAFNSSLGYYSLAGTLLDCLNRLKQLLILNSTCQEGKYPANSLSHSYFIIYFKIVMVNHFPNPSAHILIPGRTASNIVYAVQFNLSLSLFLTLFAKASQSKATLNVHWSDMSDGQGTL